MKGLLAILVLVGVVYGQTPKPCLAPSLFEARMVEIDYAKEFETRARIAYDAHNERFHSYEEVFIGEKKDHFASLFLHKERKEYRLNLATKKCETHELTRPFRHIGIPENATFYDETIIGSLSEPGAGVLVQLWGGHTERGRYVGSWTVHGCVPIHESYHRFNSSESVHTDFFDVTAGIHDPTIFIPPQECM
ncbi:mammalian ependymin-related protein 1-like [Glandiceps talaboti]